MNGFGSDAYFLGPKSENAAWVRAEFQAILEHWFDWRQSLFMDDPSPLPPARRLASDYLKEREHLAQHLQQLCDMLCSEVPKYTPRYIGHMVSELSLPALFGHFATLLHNPNNTSREVARVGGRVEDEAIAMLAEMVGYAADAAQGHFTGGGTLANFEAVWRARYRLDHFLALALYEAETNQTTFAPFSAAHIGWKAYRQRLDDLGIDENALRPYSGVLQNPFAYAERMTHATGHPWRGPVLLVPGNKHFSWRKAVNVFGMGEDAFWNIPLDKTGHLSLDGLKQQIARAQEEHRPILAVVTVAGTTEAGEIDPIDEVCDQLYTLRKEGLDIWHHVDAAYGGFFCSMLGGEAECVLATRQIQALRAIRRVNSVTLDPHKLGYVPYACGAFLTRDAESYVTSSFQAPYIDRATTNDKWACTLEGSRSAAGAAATWLTGKTIGFVPSRFGKLLSRTVHARKHVQQSIAETIPHARFVQADTNILCISLAHPNEPLSVSNARTTAIFKRFQQAPGFSVSQTVLSAESYDKLIDAHVHKYQGQRDTDQLVLLRCVFMNPFWNHKEVADVLLPEFLQTLKQFCEEVEAENKEETDETR